jgi:para-nitrobenzyl esterase
MFNSKNLLIAFAGLLFLAQVAHAQDVYVPTESGLAHGLIDGGMRSFRGLRYAAPPLGDLRWRDPEPPPLCPNGLCEATNFGPICLQIKASGIQDGSEDCLTLNVFTPLNAGPGTPLPVMFFVHGGGLARGSSHAQVPTAPPIVVDQNVVVVTIEYRLGVFGTLSQHQLTAESGGSGDYCYFDTIAALEWVQRNIAQFGGDPQRVMLFGHSAGGTIVTQLAAAPRAAGLFATIGLESGPLGEGQPLPSVTDCEPQGDYVAAAVNCDHAPDVLGCMRAAPALDLFNAYRSMPASAAPGCVDAIVDARLTGRQPLDVIRAGKTVPMLIGENSREDGHDPDTLFSADQYYSFVNDLLGPFGPQAVNDALKLYPLDSYPTPIAAGSDLYNDFIVGRGNRTWALAAANDKPGADKKARPVYKYFFTHTMENPDSAVSGAFHGLELSFVFGTIPLGVSWFSGPFVPTPAEVELTHSIEGYWARFAATGDPNGPGAVFWPKFQPKQEKFLRLDDLIQQDNRYHVKQLKFLAQFNSHAS